MEADKKVKGKLKAVRKHKTAESPVVTIKTKKKITPEKVPQSQSAPASTVCLEGMSVAELTMVRRLAGNDPAIRKKTLRKLKKWLNVLSQKVPDTPDCRKMIEPNFIRVWKALFYCMWMADKPLPQEQLAESLSNLQNLFAGKTYPFLLFVEWFIRTIAREWNWIDRFRMDKFMMLFRRFLRKSLLVICDKKWQNDMLVGYLNIVATYIFNRHPTSKGKKQKQTTFISPVPLGLQIHFIDIFMEEVAKVGGEQLKFQKTLKLLSVFMHELSYSNDDRLLEEIRERIFNHLMRQSDVGIDYNEQLFGNTDVDDGDEMDGDLEDIDDSVEEETDELIGDIDAEFEMDDSEDQILDPRAGAVDAILPQLDIDYEVLYKKLIEYGGQKDIKLKNRRVLYSLASQFKELTEGKYPLALPEDNIASLNIPQKEVNKAARNLLEMENGDGKRRKTKKERKREAKRKQNASIVSMESAGSEDASQYIHDDDLLDHVADNYMSYLEDEIQDGPGDNVPDAAEASNDDNEKKGSPKEKKTKKETEKNRKRKWKTVVEVEAEENLQETDSAVGNLQSSKSDKNEKEETIVIKKKRCSVGSNEKPSTPILGKSRRFSELKTPIRNSTPGTTNLDSANKRVSFVLARNREHEHADYPVSIARSPAIPFDKHRQPGIGLLKSPATTPKSTPTRRAAALDFF